MKHLTHAQWLQSLPDHMLWQLAEEGSRAAWEVIEKREEEQRRNSYPESMLPE